MGRKVTTLEEASDVYITGSICLTDIPKEQITVGKNGKKYIQVVIGTQKELGRFGDSHYVKTSTKKDSGLYPVFIGNGVQWINDDVQAPSPNNGDTPAPEHTRRDAQSIDDLPF